MLWIAIAVGVAFIVLIVANRQGDAPSDAAAAPPADDAHRLDLPVAEPEREPMRVTRMKVWGCLTIEDADGAREERFPPSPRGAGEFPTAIWGAPDGTVWITAKLYSGAPGPDDGVVYSRAPDGTWNIEFILPEYTLHSIVGWDGYLFAGAIGGYVYFDGESWASVRLPEYSMMWKVFLDAEGPYVRSWGGEHCFRIDGETLRPAEGLPEPDIDPKAFEHAGVRWQVFDRSEEVEEVELTPEQEAAWRAEFDQLAIAIADGTAKVRRLD